MLKIKLILSFLFIINFSLFAEFGVPHFNMEELLNSSTLDVNIDQDWHIVKGRVDTKQKLVSIYVGDFWPGQAYRVPVRMIVPVDRKAKGFHLTGGHQKTQLEKDARLNPIESELIQGGVGLVYTVVQELGRSGYGKLAQAIHKKFIQTLNPRHTVKYWGWPASLIRCVTLAYSEKDYFLEGKVALSGGSKNGASPTVALIHDKRLTAVHASVSPMFESPLRLCDETVWEELNEYNKSHSPKKNHKPHAFLGGVFGPIYNYDALAAGHSWEDLKQLAYKMQKYYFVSKNMKQLKEREVDLYFHPGTHDFVAFDVPYGGKHYPELPIYLRINSGHGLKARPQSAEKGEANLAGFLFQHFFEGVGEMLTAPSVEYVVNKNDIAVKVKFKNNEVTESGTIWWMYDRGPDGSFDYISELFPENQTDVMIYNKKDQSWNVSVPLKTDVSKIDFFSNHRKTLSYNGKPYPTYISSPYQSISLKNN